MSHDPKFGRLPDAYRELLAVEKQHSAPNQDKALRRLQVAIALQASPSVLEPPPSARPDVSHGDGGSVMTASAGDGLLSSTATMATKKLAVLMISSFVVGAAGGVSATVLYPGISGAPGAELAPSIEVRLPQSVGEASVAAISPSEPEQSAEVQAFAAPSLSMLPRISPPTPSQLGAKAPPTPSLQPYDTSLAAERALVEAARTALSRGDQAATLESLDKHAAIHPDGRLVEEREALAIQALVAAGQVEEARTRAVRFRARFPQSLLRPVVEDALRRATPSTP